MVRTLRSTKTLFLLLVGFWLASETVTVSPGTEQGIEAMLVIGLLVQGAFWANAALAHLIDRYRTRQLEVDPGGATAIGAMSFVARCQRRSQRSQLWRLKMSHPAGGDEPQIVAASRRLRVRLG